jgi:hypothetical protein
VTASRRRLPTHAFVDESRRGNRYILTAALIASRDVQPTTVAVRAALPRGRRRAHFSAEGDTVRRQILDAYCRLSTQVVVAVSEYLGGSDQAARDACLIALVESLEELAVGALVLDTRGVLRDRLDRQTIERALEAARAPREIYHAHRGSRDEVLLGVPGAIGWAYGAGGLWRKKIEPLILATLKA